MITVGAFVVGAGLSSARSRLIPSLLRARLRVVSARDDSAERAYNRREDTPALIIFCKSKWEDHRTVVAERVRTPRIARRTPVMRGLIRRAFW